MSSLPKHDPSGKCPRCQVIFDRYPNFYLPLREWFENLQQLRPEAHISCAGRGELDQEEAFNRGASRANFGESAHNWNAAIDIFCEINADTSIYDKTWFYDVLAKRIPADFTWYGQPHAEFFELPHVELSGWKVEAKSGLLRLVEHVSKTPTGPATAGSAQSSCPA